jgi:hypothetical protein
MAERLDRFERLPLRPLRLAVERASTYTCSIGQHPAPADAAQATMLHGDIRDLGSVKDALSGRDVDVVVERSAGGFDPTLTTAGPCHASARYGTVWSSPGPTSGTC